VGGAVGATCAHFVAPSGQNYYVWVPIWRRMGPVRRRGGRRPYYVPQDGRHPANGKLAAPKR